jgi:uncharacterized membrane protein
MVSIPIITFCYVWTTSDFGIFWPYFFKIWEAFAMSFISIWVLFPIGLLLKLITFIEDSKINISNNYLKLVKYHDEPNKTNRRARKDITKS